MAEYQPFSISTNQTGLFNYLQPWIRPDEAYEPLNNAQVYRGQVNKRNGYIQFGNQLADTKPVMGIMRYQNESTGLENLVVTSTKNAYLYDDGANTFSALTSVVSSNFWKGNVTMGGTITVPTFWPNIAPSSVSITDGTSTITDDGAGNLSAAGNFAAGSTINYVTGSVTLNFVAAVAGVSLSITCTSTNYFTGTISNFFNWTNWQPTDPVTSVESKSYLYMVNNKDPVTLFDGTNLSRPILYIDNAKSNYIATCFDIKVFQNRLLAILPSLATESNPLNQTIFWSAQYNPTNFTADIAGNGGQLAAATGDLLQSFNFLRDICIVRFSRSVWTFRYTNNDFDPFRFTKLNVSKRTNCPYASISYDTRETGIGSTGITACDGVNVERADLQIIDFYETEMSETYYSQSFSQRYDNNSTTWTLYVSQESLNPLVGSVAPGSDKALIYNFLENTWATYQFSTPLTCLGLYNSVTGKKWSDFVNAPQDEWQNQNNPWFSYSNQKSAPILLSGDTSGNVYWMDNENQDTDNGTIIPCTITSTRWNPFIRQGQKVQFGYIDFYYSRINDCVLTLNFSIDNSSNVDATRTLTLSASGNDGNANSDYAMQRVYINTIGEFLQMTITSSSAATFQINGLILWARPAGRLTP